ncbi:MAG: hypothetical protein ACRD12_17585, partial [Acidimicrobiales bacterium]
ARQAAEEQAAAEMARAGQEAARLEQARQDAGAQAAAERDRARQDAARLERARQETEQKVAERAAPPARRPADLPNGETLTPVEGPLLDWGPDEGPEGDMIRRRAAGPDDRRRR